MQDNLRKTLLSLYIWITNTTL